MQYGLDGDELIASLKVGDNFDVNVEEGNSEGQDFQIVCCTKPLHRLNSSLKCKWGTNYSTRDEVLVRKYYKKWGNSYSSYVLLKDSNVLYMYSHLVRVVKFLMPLKDYRVSSNDSLFELLSDAVARISSVIDALDDEA